MASNYTTNYQLPIWAAGDSFLRTEFNDANEKIDEALAGKCEVSTGSYTGNGTYGSGNPNTLTFEKKPVLVFVRDDAQVLTLMRPVTTSPNTAHTNYGKNTTTWTENGVSWYNNEGVHYQMSASGRTYHYLALLI